MKNFNLRKYLLVAITALVVALACALPTVALAENSEKPEFDVSTIVYEDKTVVYDGQDHYIEPGNLPNGAFVDFNTYASQPGIYESVAYIIVGEEYKTSVVTVRATLTILATELKWGDGSFVAENGIDPTVKFTMAEGEGYDFSGDLPGKQKLYASYSTALTKDGSAYALAAGEYKMSIKQPVGYADIKVLVKTAAGVKEVATSWEGNTIYFDVDESVTDFAITYGREVRLNGAADEGWLLWVQIGLGVVVVGEAITIILQALKLKK